MAKELRRIGILTSGGDAPGMNAAIRAAVRNCLKHDVTPVGIRRGYNGLIHADTYEMEASDVSGIISRGGTMLYTARCEEFKTPEGVAQAVRTCRYCGLDGIIAIGGELPSFLLQGSTPSVSPGPLTTISGAATIPSALIPPPIRPLSASTSSVTPCSPTNAAPW